MPGLEYRKHFSLIGSLGLTAFLSVVDGGGRGWVVGCQLSVVSCHSGPTRCHSLPLARLVCRMIRVGVTGGLLPVRIMTGKEKGWSLRYVS